MEPFVGNIDLKKDLDISIDKSKSTSILPDKKYLLFIILICILLLSNGILLYFLLNKDSKPESEPQKEPHQKINDKKSGEIICIYNIKDISSKTPLLSKDFQNYNNSIIEIFINNTKINFVKEYQFPSEGTFNIKYILNSKIKLDNMFKGMQNIQSIVSMSIYLNSTIKILSMKGVFESCPNLRNIALNGTFDTSELRSMSKLFYKSGIQKIDFNGFDTKYVEDMSFMFSSTNISDFSFLNKLNTNKVKNISRMFKDCISLETININFDLKNVEDISGLFENCNNLKKVDLSNFNNEKINNGSNLFANCESLVEINGIEKLNTKNIKNMSKMFYYCSNIKKLNLSSFDTSQVTTFSRMFEACY